MKKVIENTSSILVIIISVCAISIIVSDMLDIINLVNISIVYQKLILFLLSSLGVYIASVHLTNKKITNDIRKIQDISIKGFSEITNAMHNTSVVKFPNSVEIHKYFIEKIKNAKDSVYDLSWSESYSTHHALSPRKKINYEYEKIIDKASDRIEYKEIFIFSELERIEKLNRRLKSNKFGYSCKYFENTCSIPRIQFAIIDKEEIIWGYPDNQHTVFKNKDLAIILSKYFDEIWDKATCIKERDDIFHDEVKKIQSYLILNN